MMNSFARGQIMVELLIAISLMAVIGALVIHFGFLGLRSTKVGGGQTVMIGLAQEGIEGIEAMANSNWHSIYNLTGKGTIEYYPKVVSNAWSVATAPADKVITLDSISYNRWAIVDNTSRDATTRDIEGTYSAANDDPSTQKITLNVTSISQPDIQLVRFIARARNTTATQTAWQGGSGQGTNPTSGFDADFNTQFFGSDSNIDTATAGSIKILPQ